MSDADIEKAVKEAAEFEAQDKKRKEGIDARNEAESMVFQVEKALNEAGANIDPAQKSTVEADLQALKDVLAKSTADSMTDADISEIKAANEKLMTGAQALFQKMYEQAAAAQQAAGQGAGPDMGGAQSNPGDDVVDGDYKEV